MREASSIERSDVDGSSSAIEILVVGCQRSGTVLAANALGSLRGAIACDEHDRVYPYVESRLESASSWRSRFWRRRVFRSARRKYRRPRERASLFGELAPGIRLIALQVPNLTYRERELARSFAGCQVLYMVRNPLDVVSSMLRIEHLDMIGNQRRLLERHREVYSENPRAAAVLEDVSAKRHQIAAAIVALKMSRAGRFEASGLATRVVRYEDLVRSPAEVVRGFLEPIDPRLASEVPRPESVLRGVGPGNTDRSRAIDARSVGAGKERLDARSRAEVEEILGDLVEGRVSETETGAFL